MHMDKRKLAKQTTVCEPCQTTPLHWDYRMLLSAYYMFQKPETEWGPEQCTSGGVYVPHIYTHAMWELP